MRHRAVRSWCVSIPQAKIGVSDSGPDVSTAEREHLFKRFWRGARAGSDGSGLGLAIVAETMAAHGGNVAVADNPGGGAVFSLVFPTVAAHRY